MANIDPKLKLHIEHECAWHNAINEFHHPGGLTSDPPNKPHRSWMYEAKKLAFEVPRLEEQHRRERLALLATEQRQCSLSELEEIKDNHLTCCLGVKCRSCPELVALEQAKMPPEAIDRAKAWTCAAHIVASGGDRSNEGYVTDEGDKLYWRNVYRSMTRGLEDREIEEGPNDE